jgi:hypothetical protein
LPVKSTRPSPFDNDPYFAALVQSSFITSDSAIAADGPTSIAGTVFVKRVP